MRSMNLTFIFACKISDQCIQSFTLIVVVDSYGCYTICYMPYYLQYIYRGKIQQPCVTKTTSILSPFLSYTLQPHPTVLPYHYLILLHPHQHSPIVVSLPVNDCDFNLVSELSRLLDECSIEKRTKLHEPSNRIRTCITTIITTHLLARFKYYQIESTTHLLSTCTSLLFLP